MTESFDVIVIGAGMAGASVGSELAAHARVLLLEREAQPGYHATGRSAAAFIPSYGASNRVLYGLTRASSDFLSHPPEGFSPVPLLRQRGLLTVTGATDAADLRAEYHALRDPVPELKLLQGAAVLAKVPALRSAYARAALYEPEVFDMDVDALLQGYLRRLRARGGTLLCGVALSGLQAVQSQWRVHTGQGVFTAPVIVNAAGAWADTVAKLADVTPIGLQPLRRTAVLIDPPDGAVIDDWPLLLAQDESFYAKPDAGALLVSPADEHPSAPVDARPEELDIAYAVHNAQQALEIEHPRVRHSWAGLRSFVADRTPVVGFDPAHAGFFWLCGQGGHGIQTAPGLAQLAAALVLQQELPPALQAVGLNPDWLAPARLRAD